MSPSRVAIRADASAEIGLGHVTRCLALAAALRRAGVESVFIGKELGGTASEIVVGRGFPFVSLADDLDEAADVGRTLEVLRDREADVLLVDHYGLGASSHRLCRAAGVPLALVDDEANEPGLECDLLLNQNVGVVPESYATSTARWKLCGTEYALLRDEFLRAAPRVETREPPLHLLVTLGGADPVDATRHVVASARRSGALDRITAVAGPAYRFRESLRDQAAADERLFVVEGARDMAALLTSADLAVTAGGSTCYECAYLGVPALVVQIAQNQAGIARGMAREGCARFLGPAETLTHASILESIDDLASDGEARAEMTRLGRALVDGRGAARVARALVELGIDYDGAEPGDERAGDQPERHG